MHLWDSGKATKDYHIIILALFPKVPKIQRPKALKLDVFDYPTIA